MEGYRPQYYTGTPTYDEYGWRETGMTGGIWEDAALDKFYWITEIDTWDGGDMISDYVYLGYRGVTKNWIDENLDGVHLPEHHDNKHVLIWSDNGENGARGAFFSRKRDPLLDGKIMSVSEFEKNAWYYCPGVTCTEGNHRITAPKGILTQHINAVKEFSTDTSVKSTRQTDILRVTVKRTIEGQGTEDKVFQIPIYTETRGCVYNQK